MARQLRSGGNRRAVPGAVMAAPAPPSAAVKAAIQHHQAGRLAEAEAAYRQILDGDPRNATALHYLGVINSQRGRYDKAIELINKAIRIEPNLVGPHVNLANSLSRAGRIEEAEQHYRHALGLDPNNAEAFMNLGITLRRLKRLPEALDALGRAVALAPGNPHVHYNLGNALKEDEKYAEAEESYVRAVTLRPDYCFALNNLALARIELGNMATAEASYRQSLRFQPKLAETHYNLGNLLRRVGRHKEAREAYQTAIDLKPDYAAAYNNSGICYHSQRMFTDAEPMLRKAIEIQPDYYEARMNLADTLFEMNRPAEAIELYNGVIANDDDDVAARIRLANVFRNRGNKAEAEEVLGEILARDAKHFRAHHLILEINRGKPGQPSVEVFEELLGDEETSETVRITSGFTLAEYYDSVGEYAKGFKFLDQANRTKRSTYEYDIEETVELTEKIKATFTPDMISAWGEGGCQDATPILIVGMPRSGSTLVEQILDCHSQISGAGEASVSVELERKEEERFAEKYPAFLERWREVDRCKFGEAYVSGIRLYSRDTPRVVDKMLHNFIRLGIIKLCLPNARVLRMKRNPLDVCLSIYFSDFLGRHRYAYSLKELGTYYRLYEGVMQHWHEVMPGAVLDVPYETLVAEPEEQVSRILDYCGLDFEPACLEFHTSDRVVRTKSALQVRSPLNTRGIDRWRNYEAELAPLREALGEDLAPA